MVSWLAVTVTVLNVAFSVTAKKTVLMVPMKTAAVSMIDLSKNQTNILSIMSTLNDSTFEELLLSQIPVSVRSIFERHSLHLH